jgi:hypothetical protein
MAKRKNLFLPPPKWTLMRLLRTLILFGVFAAAGAACWLAYFALTPVEVASRARHFNIEHGLAQRGGAAKKGGPDFRQLELSGARASARKC